MIKISLFAQVALDLEKVKGLDVSSETKRIYEILERGDYDDVTANQLKSLITELLPFFAEELQILSAYPDDRKDRILGLTQESIVQINERGDNIIS